MRPDCDGDAWALVAQTAPVRQPGRGCGAVRPLSGHGRQGRDLSAEHPRGGAGPGDRRVEALHTGGAAEAVGEFQCMVSVLLVATGVFLGSVLSYGMATALLVHLVVWLIRTSYTGRGFWQ